MRKFILFFILSILLISFGAFLINAFNLQSDYFKSKNSSSPEPLINDVLTKPTISLYTEYSREIYDKALSFNSVLVLYFTSNWCSECIVQEEINKGVFYEINSQDAVFLNVHILDSETTIETDALAKKYDVAKEQTIVIVDTIGVTRFKYVGEVTSDLLKQKIKEVVSK